MMPEKDKAILEAVVMALDYEKKAVPSIVVGYLPSEFQYGKEYVKDKIEYLLNRGYLIKRPGRMGVAPSPTKVKVDRCPCCGAPLRVYLAS